MEKDFLEKDIEFDRITSFKKSVATWIPDLHFNSRDNYSLKIYI